jgi:hypothetical protein
MEEFRIKKGECVFGSDRIMLEESLKGHFSNLFDLWYEGETRQKAIFAASVFAVFFSLSIIGNFLMLASVQAIAAFAVMLVAVLVISWTHKYEHGFTSEKFVRKENLDSVNFVKGRRWITCPRFILNYSEDGKEKKRYVIMPTRLIPGVDEDIQGIKEKFEEMDVEKDW